MHDCINDEVRLILEDTSVIITDSRNLTAEIRLPGSEVLRALLKLDESVRREIANEILKDLC